MAWCVAAKYWRQLLCDWTTQQIEKELQHLLGKIFWCCQSLRTDVTTELLTDILLTDYISIDFDDMLKAKLKTVIKTYCLQKLKVVTIKELVHISQQKC